MQTITLPPNALVMLVGAAGSGKSTFAERHFRKPEIVSSDFCREAVSNDPTDQRASPLSFDLYHFWIEQRLKYKRLTVADATHLKPHARQKIRELAAKYDVPVVVLTVVADTEKALKQNAKRARNVPEHVVRGHVEQMNEVMYVLPNEGYHSIVKVFPGEKYEVQIAGTDSKTTEIEAEGFDIIGDVHGCWIELTLLLEKLGWVVGFNPFAGWKVEPPTPGRKLIFVGDLTDRGPDPDLVLAFVRYLVSEGHAEMVMGNHDNKLWRALKGNNVKMGHGLQETMAILNGLPEARRNEIRDFLGARPHQLRLKVDGQDFPPVIVCHAGIPRNMVGRTDAAANSHCLYGAVQGVKDDGSPNRVYDWRQTWTAGSTDPLLVHGHDVVPEPGPKEWVNVINIDQGCCFGGKLTALSVPTMAITQVDALKTYAEK